MDELHQRHPAYHGGPGLYHWRGLFLRAGAGQWQDRGSATDPIGSLIDTATGTLRMKFVGTSGGIPSVSRGIIATYRKASPLDYLWFTQYEALDASIRLHRLRVVLPRRRLELQLQYLLGERGYDERADVHYGSVPHLRLTDLRALSQRQIASLAPSSICSGGSCGSALSLVPNSRASLGHRALGQLRTAHRGHR